MASDFGPRIADLVEVAATRLPEAPALVVTADRIAISHRDLARLVDELAGQLTRSGLLPGDRVALRMGSNAEFVVALLAASRADLVVVPLDPALPITEQRVRSQAAGARVVLIDADGPHDRAEPTTRWWPLTVNVGGDSGPSGGTLSVHLDAATEPNPATSTPEGLRPDDAMIMFTGGTTGLPKMVPWTHANIASSVRAIITGYRLSPRDATVAVMPLYHGHADRVVACHPGVRRRGVAARTRAILRAHLLGRHQSRWSHLVYGGSDDSPNPAGAIGNRTVGAQTCRTAFHPQLQRTAHCPSRASTANRVRGTGRVCLRHDRSHPPGNDNAD